MKNTSQLIYILLSFGFLVFSGCQRSGCTYKDALNFDNKATRDDGSCQFALMNDTTNNNNGSGGNGNGNGLVLGCTDSTADNYNPLANQNDGSCVYSGCTDPFAENFNSKATIDDGSCIFARDKFLGNYTVTNTCGGFVNIGTDQEMRVGNFQRDTLEITNFLGGSNIFAVASGTSLTIPNQNTGLGGFFEINGSGTITSDRNTINMQLNYTIQNPFQNISDNCNITYTRN